MVDIDSHDKEKSALRLEIVTPEEMLYSEEVEMAIVPGSQGEMGILLGHVPLISTISGGIVQAVGKGMQPKKKYAVFEGFVEISGKKVTILADKAYDMDSLSKESVEKNIKELKEDIEHSDSNDKKAKLEKEKNFREVILRSLS